MKFDTRDKKPAVFNILILSVAAAVVIAVLFFTGKGANTAVISGVFALYLFIVLCMLAGAFFKQLQYNPYSYNTIIYMGFFLFLLSVLITFISLTMQLVRDPGAFGVQEIVQWLTESAGNFMLLSFPFVFVFSLLLCISNISLIRHERKRLVNVLGIILSFLMVGGALIFYLMNYSMSGSAQQIMVRCLAANLLACVYLYFECMLIGAIAASLIVLHYEPEKDKDYMIILGCGLLKDGTPTPILRGRIDRAIAFYRQQKEETGKELTFVTSGGQGPNEVISESASMKQYLLSQGIPEEKIIEEDRSTSTLENMRFSKEKIEEAGKEGKVAFSTTNYHVFRGGLCARRVKMRAVGIGAKTKWYFWPNAWVREFIGLLTEHRGKQGLILGSMIVIYTVLTLLAYR